jgi:hypothetical protein
VIVRLSAALIVLTALMNYIYPYMLIRYILVLLCMAGAAWLFLKSRNRD